MSLRVAVIRFPGSNCDDDAFHVVNELLGDDCKGHMVWHKDRDLGKADAVILPGGFSYGDYLRAGCMASHSPVMESIVSFAQKGGPVLGICNGFQILCESGLLEGTLTRNESLRFVCKDVFLRVEGRPTPFTRSIPAGEHIKMSIAHAEGRYVHPEVERLEGEGQVLFRYCDAEGETGGSSNPNGSLNNIAGICNASGNVVGLMPHPERAVEEELGGGGIDGLLMFRSLLGDEVRS